MNRMPQSKLLNKFNQTKRVPEEGVHKFSIYSAEELTSKNGTLMIRLKLKLDDGTTILQHISDCPEFDVIVAGVKECVGITEIEQWNDLVDCQGLADIKINDLGYPVVKKWIPDPFAEIIDEEE
jgi:hypothetical protein